MKTEDIDRFFEELARHFPQELRVYVLGGTAALLYGGVRPTLDIDFEAVPGKGRDQWENFEKAVKQAEQATHVTAQYGENVDRWSSLTMLDYRRSAKPYKTFGKLRVYLFSPISWSMGKISRFQQHDCDDLLAVFSRHKPDPMELAKAWKEALEKSPRGDQLSNIKRNMLYFLKQHGPKVWGKGFSAKETLRVFQEAWRGK